MTNPLIDKWEELNKKKEEPKVAFEFPPEFRQEYQGEWIEDLDKQKEDQIRYLASLPKDLHSVATGPGGITASCAYETSFSNNYINASNASVSYKPYKKPISTHDIERCKQQYLQVAEMVKTGTARVTNMTTEFNWNIYYKGDEHKVIFEVILDH